MKYLVSDCWRLRIKEDEMAVVHGLINVFSQTLFLIHKVWQIHQPTMLNCIRLIDIDPNWPIFSRYPLWCQFFYPLFRGLVNAFKIDWFSFLSRILPWKWFPYTTIIVFCRVDDFLEWWLSENEKNYLHHLASCRQPFGRYRHSLGWPGGSACHNRLGQTLAKLWPLQGELWGHGASGAVSYQCRPRGVCDSAPFHWNWNSWPAAFAKWGMIFSLPNQ